MKKDFEEGKKAQKIGMKEVSSILKFHFHIKNHIYIPALHINNNLFVLMRIDIGEF